MLAVCSDEILAKGIGAPGSSWNEGKGEIESESSRINRGLENETHDDELHRDKDVLATDLDER